MKWVMIFTVLVIVGLGVMSGAGVQKRELRPRSSASVEIFAPGAINESARSISSINELMRAQKAEANQADATAEFTTYTNAPIYPSEYNGDVRDLPRVHAREKEQEEEEGFELQMHEPPALRDKSAFNASNASGEFADAVNNVPLANMPAPIQSFKGLSLADDCAGAPCGIGQPPDANGDVGPNHYVLAVNFGIGIYNKTGTLLAKFSEDSLWKNANSGTPCDHQSHGDPVVVYDQLADRWIISNFAFGFNENGPANPIYQCFAVSKSGDPVSGGWRFYAMQTDTGAAGQPPPHTLSDYPRLGNWNDGCLYMSANEFNFPGGKYLGTMFASLNKSDMYNGLPLTSSIGFINDPNSSYTIIPSNISGAKSSDSLPAPGTPVYFVAQSRRSYSWEIRKFTPGTSPKICGGGGSMGAPINIPQTQWDGPDAISQPNANDVGSVGERLMQKVQYRRVGNKESLWVVHSVESPANSPIKSQWGQIDVSGGNVRTTAVQQQIYTPDTTLERWIPSLAVDHNGNMAVGYNMSSSSVFPGIAYSGRLANDPLNQLSQGETVLVNGNGSQRNQCEGGPCKRWGDYSSMSIDPSDDCTFWFVGQYYDSQSSGDSGNWQTRIGSFRFPSCSAPVVNNTLTVASTNPSSGVSITVTPDDNNGLDNGSAPFTRTYLNGVSVNLTAPNAVGGNSFQKWQRDGADFSSNASTSVMMDANHSMTAVYITPTTRSLSISSSAPDSGVNITVSPNDNNSAGSGSTTFNRTYNSNTVVNLTAPATAGGNSFQKWQRDGADYATTAATSVTMDGDHSMKALYLPPSPVSVTVQTNPVGRSFTVDGNSFNGTQTFSWTPGSTHTIATSTSPQSGGTGTQFVWSNWSDGGAISHVVTASQPITYTANFKTQYLLTMVNGDGGVSFPLTGFYDAGQAVSITATPGELFYFQEWTGTGSGSFSSIFRAGAVTMNGPITETAVFNRLNTTIEFSAANYNVSESVGVVNVTITRTGDPVAEILATVITSDGTAEEGRDYEASQALLTFEKGEMSKNFPVLIIDNGHVDSVPRTVNIKINNVRGAYLGVKSSALVTITNNDSAGAANPVDDAHAFVQLNYYDFLRRYPDASGWDFWTNEIKNCGTNSACIDVKRVNVSGAFFLSIEFQQTGYLVERFYKVAYGDANASSINGGPHQLRVPILRFNDFIRDMALIGGGVVVNQPGWEQLLESNKQLYADTFVRSARFVSQYESILPPDKFVDQLNQNAGNVLSSSERTAAINRFGGAPDSSNLTARGQVLRQIAEDPDLVAAENNRAFVLAQYFGYLRRNPDDPPEANRDYSGYDFWLTKLNQFKGNYVGAQMVKAFITSSEYRQRFGQ
jgi:hypothetical protein